MRVRSAKQLIIVLRERTQQSKEQRGSSVSRDLSRLCDLSGRVRAKPRKRDFRPWRPLPTNSPPDCLVLFALRLLEQIASAIFSLLQAPSPLQNKKSKPIGLLFLLVRETGLEPVHQRYTPLKRARLPIPPLPRGTLLIIHERVSKVKGFFEKIFYFLKNSFFHQKSDQTALKIGRKPQKKAAIEKAQKSRVKFWQKNKNFTQNLLTFHILRSIIYL